jgi:hypothetical protein
LSSTARAAEKPQIIGPDARHIHAVSPMKCK